ncbi:MAG: glycosyltransferase [Acidimicrobiia bacterium]|nr:glycosyltransferase [Acidimicrobiia bacterium]NNL12428.1 glycosyltransferase [Acidimicrobiia bacterium]
MLPAVSIILPVFNESGYLEPCLASLEAQAYGGPIEIVVADGRSTDGTRQALEAFAAEGRIVLVDNPERRQWSGLNRAAEQATGEILVRVDGHAVYSPDYVGASVAALEESGATAAGGRMIPESDTPVGRAVVSAMASAWAVGPARYRHQTHRSLVDTVYLGAYRAADFVRLGGYRDLPGVAEDADLYYRWRRQGATILLDPAIQSTYRPRTAFRAVARQYFRYGWGKADMLYANRTLPSLRPLAPLGLLLGLLGTAALGTIAGIWWPSLALLAAWGLVLLWVGVRAGDGPLHRLRTMAVTATMQLSFGAGLAGGVARGPGSRRHLQS